MLRRASNKQISNRALRVEPLEAKRMLNVDFGFVDVAGGFVFIIDGDDVNENYQMWTNVDGNLNTNFVVRDLTDGTISLADSVSAGEIANEATQRNLTIGDFEGFEIKAQGGNDLVVADGSENVLDPSDPNLPEFFGQKFRADGGAGFDTLRGGPGDDVLSTGPAPNNDDTEEVTGGDGNDTIMGNNGRDSLSGGNGNDMIEGGSNNDTLDGGAGNDDLDGEDGNDRLFGRDGNDTIEGGGGDDTMQGDHGADALSGGDGDDSLQGDDDDKDPKGGAGTDGWQAGGPGMDEPTGDDQDPTPGINITTDDIEKIRTDGSNEGMCPKKDGNQCGHSGGDDGKRFDTPGPFVNEGPYSFNDTVNVQGWTDNDVPGPHVIVGGGNDTVIGSDTGHDRVDAGDGNDTVSTGGGNDTINGGNGDDSMEGGAGADTINGGAGSDTASYASSDAPVNYDLDVRKGGDGADKCNLNGDYRGSGGHAQGDYLVPVAPGDNSVENLVGSAFDDTLTGDADDNLLDGNDGDDTLRGAGGDDAFLGDDGNDLLEGDTGQECFAGSGLAHADGRDTLRGGKNEDLIRGGGNDDFLDGGLGDDDLAGELGIDGMVGDKGEDILRMEFGVHDDETIPGKVLIDLNSDTSVSPPRNAFGVFGAEGGDNFIVSGTTSIEEELQVRGDLAFARNVGFTDFDNNDDDLEFN